MHSSLDCNGAFLINKEAGVSSFGVIEQLQRVFSEKYATKRRDLPKMGHGGTLDPFATGLLIVCVGKGVKLSRYFLGSKKEYEAVIRFGETTIPGDPTAPISETSEKIPASTAEIQGFANEFTKAPYLQTPPMHSAKKVDGKPLYELARQGIEIERESKACTIYEFAVQEYAAPCAKVRVSCSSGTYIRTLAQDFGKKMGTVAMLDSLNRTSSGPFSLTKGAMTIAELSGLLEQTSPASLGCFVPFDRLLDSFPRIDINKSQATALFHGKQNVILEILSRLEESPENSRVALYHDEKLIAVANLSPGELGIERVFVTAL